MGKSVLGRSSVEDHLFLLVLEAVDDETGEVDAYRSVEVGRGICAFVHGMEKRRLEEGRREPYRRQGASMVTAGFKAVDALVGLNLSSGFR